MKHILPLLVAAVLLFGACERSEYTTRITGTLYTDSTLTVPVANDTVWFYDYTYHGKHPDSILIGHALTDQEGRFGFLDWSVDVSSYDPRYESKFKIDFGQFIIVHWPDTLFRGEYSGKYNQLVLYPGKYKIQQY
ncbi:MAG: hypothetical protein IJL48_09830 [Bacteroidales bacterium]|nr:hypothetical protein [Bacteroidales bacterium]